MLTEATATNLRRKAHWADHVQIRDGVPLPSWIDISVTELCNRSHGSPKACRFCPRIDPAFYPNQSLHMSAELARKIGEELRALEFEGAVVLCGYGEPLLHPDLASIVEAFRGVRVEIITNGDRLSVARIRELSAAGCGYFVVSMYDGEHQSERFAKMFEAAECPDYILRDRWYSEDDDFGLKLTNRAGSVNAGHQPEVNVTSPCYYPAYSLTVDWQGDVLLCVQDWQKRQKYGNLAGQSIMDVWTGAALRKRRKQLFRGRDGLSPCSGCNASGTVHGADHAAAWRA